MTSISYRFIPKNRAFLTQGDSWYNEARCSATGNMSYQNGGNWGNRILISRTFWVVWGVWGHLGLWVRPSFIQVGPPGLHFYLLVSCSTPPLLRIQFLWCLRLVCGLFYDPRMLLLPTLAVPSLQEQWLSRHTNGRLSDLKLWCFPDPMWQTIAVIFCINRKASPPWNAALSTRDTMLEIPHIPRGNAKDRILFHVGSHL